MSDVSDDQKTEVCEKRIVLMYADDIVVIGEMKEEIIYTTSKLLRASKTIGLCVNKEKKKYLMVVRKSPTIDHIIVNDYRFKKVEVFKYQVVNINNNNNMNKEMNDRIVYANRYYYSIIKLLKSKLLSRNSITL